VPRATKEPSQQCEDSFHVGESTLGSQEYGHVLDNSGPADHDEMSCWCYKGELNEKSVDEAEVKVSIPGEGEDITPLVDISERRSCNPQDDANSVPQMDDDHHVLDEGRDAQTQAKDVSEKQYGPVISTEAQVHQSDTTSSTSARLDQPLTQM